MANNITPAENAHDLCKTLEMVYDLNEVIISMLRNLDDNEKKNSRAARALRVAEHELNTIIIRMDPEVVRVCDLVKSLER